MVERNLAKVEVASSSLVSRSTFEREALASLFVGTDKAGRCGCIGASRGSTSGRLLFWSESSVACSEAQQSSRRGSKAVMQRIANPSRAVRLRPAPPSFQCRSPLRTPCLQGVFVGVSERALKKLALPCVPGLDGEIGRRSGLERNLSACAETREMNPVKVGEPPAMPLLRIARQHRAKPPRVLRRKV